MNTITAKTEADLINALWNMLRTQSRRVKLSLASKLTSSVLEEESSFVDLSETKSRRKVKSRYVTSGSGYFVTCCYGTPTLNARRTFIQE